jgi:hypothetical protein
MSCPTSLSPIIHYLFLMLFVSFLIIYAFLIGHMFHCSWFHTLLTKNWLLTLTWLILFKIYQAYVCVCVCVYIYIPLKSHRGGKNKSLGGSLPCLPLKYKCPPWPPVFYTLSRMTRELLRLVTLLTLLNPLTNPLTTNDLNLLTNSYHERSHPPQLSTSSTY